MKNKRSINITSLAELEQEERRVRQRIKMREAELMSRVKKLPEEVVTAAIIKLVSSVLEGGAIKTVVSFAKRVGKNLLSNFFKDLV